MELGIGERNFLCETVLEYNLHACLSRLLFRSLKHLARGIEPVHSARSPDMAFGCNRKRPGAAAHIQHGLTSLKASEAQHLFSKCPLLSQHRKPDREVVENW